MTGHEALLHERGTHRTWGTRGTDEWHAGRGWVTQDTRLCYINVALTAPGEHGAPMSGTLAGAIIQTRSITEKFNMEPC